MTSYKTRGIELKCSIEEMLDQNGVIFGWQWTHDVYAAHALMKAIEEGRARSASRYSDHADWIEHRAAEILESEFGIKP